MRRFAPFLVVFVLPFLLYWKLFHPDPEERLILRGDFLNQHYVWKSYALSRVKSGELPLWNPHILAGEPFHANPQAGIFYPPTYLLAPFHGDGKVSYVALEGYQLLHQAFAGFGMLLFLGSLGVGGLGALAGAIAYPFTGFFTTPGHHAIVLTASWIPWSLYAVRRGPPYVLALVLALMILAGHPQIAYYGLALSLAWSLFDLGPRKSLRRFLPAAALAIGLAAVQLFPTYVLASGSSRAELGYEYSSSFGFSPYFLAAVFAPRGQVRLPGQDGSAPLHIYAGIGTLLFAFIGLSLSKDRARLFFAATAALALFLSFGRDSPLYDWSYGAIPGFSSFRVPYRLLGVWTLGLSVLAALGVHRLSDASRKDRVLLRSLARGAFVVLVALGLWATNVHVRLLAGSGALEPSDVDRVVGAAHWAVLLAALNFLLLLLFLWRPRERYVLPALLVLLAVDVAAFVKDRAQHPSGTLVRAGERDVHRLLKAQGPKSRYVTDSNLESYDMLHGTEFAGGHAALVESTYDALLAESSTSANALSVLNVKFVARATPASEYPWCGPRFASPLPLLDVPASLSPARIEITPPLQARRLVLYWSPLGPGGTASIELLGKSHALAPGEPLDVEFEATTAVTGLRVDVEPGSPGVRLDDIEVDLNPIGLRADFLTVSGIHVNLHALPRAYFMVPSQVPSERKTVESLRCWSVHEGIQVEDPETSAGASGFFRKDAVEIETYRPELVELRTTSPRDGYAVLSDSFHPGWSAAVDGEPAPILRAQSVLRAVPVPAGRHRVRFTYRPRSLRFGAGTSLASLGLWFGWAVFLRFWKPSSVAS